MNLNLTYILPIRSSSTHGDRELTRYLREIARHCELVIVDGSAPEVFDLRHARWEFCAHTPVDANLSYQNGKVNGVITGLRWATYDHVIIADDDVRYDASGLHRADRILATSDLVRPQNYFHPLPWHALWDTARTLINRSLWSDFPGTLAIRKSAFLAAGGYNGDVIFENFELIRSIRAAGGRVVSPPDFFVLRRPPTARRFWSQRVQQAYDDFAIPLKLIAFLATIPGLAFLLVRRRFLPLMLLSVGSILLAETGRQRGKGSTVFPLTASLFAPIWLIERAVCSWLALWFRLVKGGYPYNGTIIARAATSPATGRKPTIPPINV